MWRLPQTLLLCVGLISAGIARADEALAPGSVDFNRDIRPILSNNCFKCHGPDDKDRQAGLRLDQRDAAIVPAESGETAITPGKSAASELVKRINSADPDERMPPPATGKTLTDAERAVLAKWIDAGAEYRAHWSLVKPERPALPAVKDRSWPRNDIDYFVLARLEQEGLAPSPPADRLALIRRVSLDLIGMPPTPEEADAFVADDRPDAYERLVDRLLASPRYGERWTRRWLDLARYADTNGYEKDRERSIWPYRDWVIRALNDDMPFDRFTIEQLAGDLLPGATLDQRIATGFHRNTMFNEEGGIDVEEFRFHAMVDRVATTGAAWLGLTLGCAQCHTHKFDPITHTEYYQFFAFLNNTDDFDLEVPSAEVTRQREEIKSQIAALEKSLESQFPVDEKEGARTPGEALDLHYAAWRKKAAAESSHWTVLRPSMATSRNHATMTILDDGSVLVSGDKPNQDTYTIELDCPQAKVTALRLEALPHESLPGGGPGRGPPLAVTEGGFILSEFIAEAAPTGSDAPLAPVALFKATHSVADAKNTSARAIDGDLDTGWMIGDHVAEPSQCVFRVKAPLENTSGGKLRITLEHRYIHQTTLGRFRISATSAPTPRASTAPADVEASLLKPDAELSATERLALRRHYLATAPELAEQHKKIAELKTSLPRQPTTMVLEERSPEHARVTRRAQRGDFMNLQEETPPGVLAALPPLPAGAPTNRLALARWLVDPNNPLVARVVVNRQWQAIFGRGIVRTTEDFGARGEAPTHPELLDWLATEFIRQGWSTKQMHRLMALSATYRQSSMRAANLEARDPDNSLLARGPRMRVEAEMVRDMALAASGLLSGKIGGPSVRPPQPAGVTELAYGAPKWDQSQGEDRYRRGLYTFAKRTSPYATFAMFDAPSGETCMVRRDRSDTPLQALTLLNDAVYVEAAVALARRTLRDAPATDDGRARRMFRLCLTREPVAEELAELIGLKTAQGERITRGEIDAEKLLAGVDPAGLDKRDLAAWAVVARAIINLDEFITKE